MMVWTAVLGEHKLLMLAEALIIAGRGVEGIEEVGRILDDRSMCPLLWLELRLEREKDEVRVDNMLIVRDFGRPIFPRPAPLGRVLVNTGVDGVC